MSSHCPQPSPRPAANSTLPPAAATDETSAYLIRQAATVGRRPAAQLWVPRLDNAAGDCLGLLKGQGNMAAGSVAIYPDGKTLATGDPYGGVGCWRLADGVYRPFQGQHSAPVQDIAVSPNSRLLATASSDYTVRIWSAASEQELLCCEGHGKEVLKISWAPDSSQFVSASADKSVRLWNALDGRCRREYWGHEDNVFGVHWSPDGRWLASASRDQTIRIWDAASGACLRQLRLEEGAAETVCWSSDSRWLASAGEDMVIRIWNAADWTVARQWEAHPGAHFVSCLAWSPDSRWLASGAHGAKTLCIWDAANGRAAARFDYPESYAWRLAWSPDGAFLASKHAGAVCRLWDARRVTTVPQPSTAPLPAELAALPAALAQLHRLQLYPPLGLLRQLLRLTSGQSVNPALATLAAQPAAQALSCLRWPAAARVGLVALLLRGLPLEEWRPPAALTPSRLQEELPPALTAAGAALAAPPPLAGLRRNLALLDDRLLALLALLGPAAVAAEPGLPLRLLAQVPILPPLSAPQRRLLTLRLPLDSGRHTQGWGLASGDAGVTRQGELRALPPSQLALPPVVLHSRYRRKELLYRARNGREPPRLRPAVLVLDASPASFGPVETTARLAAHVIAASLLAAGLPAALVAAGGAERVRLLEQPADLVELWTLRSLQPAAAARSLTLARAVRANLQDGPLEPVIVLLSHPWFGAEELLPAISGLRGLFVQYPGRQVRPALESVCERWESLSAGRLELEPLARMLA